MKTPVYKIRNLIKEYDSRCVLELPELDIYPGEIFAVVGPSGAGKSTLLRMLNFLERPTYGSITFGSREFTEDTHFPLELRRKVTTVFQRPILLNQTVRENVNFGLKIRGLIGIQRGCIIGIGTGGPQASGRPTCIRPCLAERPNELPWHGRW